MPRYFDPNRADLGNAIAEELELMADAIGDMDADDDFELTAEGLGYVQHWERDQ